jgi:2-keto-4-pentenoate hydratase/2-oxohepta-3-ene-1,7-dioic acid hydratase in catechol pathway
MKIVVYGPDKRTGVLNNDKIVDIAGAVAKQGGADAAGLADLETLIKGGQAALDKVQSAVDNLGEAGDDILFGAAGVALHAPRVRGSRVACAGGNFAQHSLAMAARRVERGEANPIQGDPRDYVRNRGFWGFWKFDKESLGNDGTVPYPARATRLDYEGEVAVVLGKQGKNLKKGQIDDFVWGVTLLGDWSIRMSPEGGPLKFAMQKNFDNSCSIGPCIVVGELDALKVDLETLVNGEVRQKFCSGDMAFEYGEYLEHLSQDFTFYPGDMISGGTGAGTAADSSQTGDDGKPLPDRFLKPGDVVDIVSPQIGTLRTHIGPSDS